MNKRKRPIWIVRDRLVAPASKANMKRLIEERVGRVRAGVIRAILLFAEVKPVRLDPR